jgi:hypothetical protein
MTVTRAIAADSPAPDRFTESISKLRGRLAADMTVLPQRGFLEGKAGAQLALAGANYSGWTRALLID